MEFVSRDIINPLYVSWCQAHTFCLVYLFIYHLFSCCCLDPLPNRLSRSMTGSRLYVFLVMWSALRCIMWLHINPDILFWYALGRLRGLGRGSIFLVSEIRYSNSNVHDATFWKAWWRVCMCHLLSHAEALNFVSLCFLCTLIKTLFSQTSVSIFVMVTTESGLQFTYPLVTHALFSTRITSDFTMNMLRKNLIFNVNQI